MPTSSFLEARLFLLPTDAFLQKVLQSFFDLILQLLSQRGAIFERLLENSFGLALKDLFQGTNESLLKSSLDYFFDFNGHNSPPRNAMVTGSPRISIPPPSSWLQSRGRGGRR